jgi:ABC-type transport system involved in cytochrome bd biosynthesis fused ATPase/permease subunit
MIAYYIKGVSDMTKKLKQIAIYGKGGIGKSTITSNISTALLGGRLQGHAIRLCSQKAIPPIR